jgi:hypothetical protein
MIDVFLALPRSSGWVFKNSTVSSSDSDGGCKSSVTNGKRAPTMKTQSNMAKMPRVELFRGAIFEILTTDKPCRVLTVRMQQWNSCALKVLKQNCQKIPFMLVE